MQPQEAFKLHICDTRHVPLITPSSTGNTTQSWWRMSLSTDKFVTALSPLHTYYSYRYLGRATRTEAGLFQSWEKGVRSTSWPCNLCAFVYPISIYNNTQRVALLSHFFPPKYTLPRFCSHNTMQQDFSLGYKKLDHFEVSAPSPPPPPPNTHTHLHGGLKFSLCDIWSRSDLCYAYAEVKEISGYSAMYANEFTRLVAILSASTIQTSHCKFRDIMSPQRTVIFITQSGSCTALN